MWLLKKLFKYVKYFMSLKFNKDNKLWNIFPMQMFCGWFSKDVKMSSFKFNIVWTCFCFHNVKVSSQPEYVDFFATKKHLSSCVVWCVNLTHVLKANKLWVLPSSLLYHLRHLLIIYAIYFHVLFLKHQIRPNVTC